MKTHTKIMANIRPSLGVHEGSLTKRSKLGALKAHTLVCFDSDEHYVKTCGADDTPWGICLNDATEKEALVSIQPLAACARTANILVSGNVQAGQLLCQDADGKVKALPTDEGVYNIVGLALTQGAANECIEALTALPYEMEVTE